jgi:two-component system NtrC family sensor kinase
VLPRFVQIRIKDNGTGIPEANLATVYEAFSSLNRPEEGAGLGLTAARRIMEELHQGELLIESEPGRGTDVYLKFYLHHDKK